MDTARENVLLANMVEAMLGAISPNFRVVSFELSNDDIRLYFLLEHENQEDREEIDDIVAKFEGLQPMRVNLRVSTDVSLGPLTDVQLSGRIVYMRREL